MCTLVGDNALHDPIRSLMEPIVFCNELFIAIEFCINGIASYL